MIDDARPRRLQDNQTTVNLDQGVLIRGGLEEKEKYHTYRKKRIAKKILRGRGLGSGGGRRWGGGWGILGEGGNWGRGGRLDVEEE